MSHDKRMFRVPSLRLLPRNLHRMASELATNTQRGRSSSGSPPVSKKPRLDGETTKQPITIEALPVGKVDLPISPIVDPSTSTSQNVDNTLDSKSKRQKQPKQPKQRKPRRPPPPDPGSAEDVNWHDIVSLLGKDIVDLAVKEEREYTSPIELWDEVELVVVDLSSNGSWLVLEAFNMHADRKSCGIVGESMSILPAPHPPWAVLVPFALPGETIRAKVYRHAKMHSYGDLISVISPNTMLRNDERIKCKYFGKCGGCQYQVCHLLVWTEVVTP